MPYLKCLINGIEYNICVSQQVLELAESAGARTGALLAPGEAQPEQTEGPLSIGLVCPKTPKTTGIHIVDRVTRALVKISNRHITWPEGARAVQTMQGFARPHGLPECMGAVDGTHIPIPAPVEHPQSYVNRKGRHSIQLQIVCDHRRDIAHAYVGHVGSVHDARVFRLSPVFGYLGDESKFPEDSHLIGDATYPLH